MVNSKINLKTSVWNIKTFEYFLVYKIDQNMVCTSYNRIISLEYNNQFYIVNFIKWKNFNFLSDGFLMDGE